MATIESANDTKLCQPDDSQNSSFPGNMAVCKDCEEVGQVTTKLLGSGWVELVLYLLWIAPGIIYSVWRRKGIKQVCAACGSNKLVAAKTRAGKQIIANQYDIFTICPDHTPVAFEPPKFGKLTAVFLGMFTVALLAAGGSMILIGIRDSDSRPMWIVGLICLAAALGTMRMAMNYWTDTPLAVKSVKIGQGLVGL